MWPFPLPQVQHRLGSPLTQRASVKNMTSATCRTTFWSALLVQSLPWELMTRWCPKFENCSLCCMKERMSWRHSKEDLKKGPKPLHWNTFLSMGLCNLPSLPAMDWAWNPYSRYAKATPLVQVSYATLLLRGLHRSRSRANSSAIPGKKMVVFVSS